jgi:hypothetical protein
MSQSFGSWVELLLRVEVTLLPVFVSSISRPIRVLIRVCQIILAFCQAMVANPDIQKRAQEEIDKVVGDDRSPNWQDYSSLPYIAQCVKETMRWRPVTPRTVTLLSKYVCADECNSRLPTRSRPRRLGRWQVLTQGHRHHRQCMGNALRRTALQGSGKVRSGPLQRHNQSRHRAVKRGLE